MKVLFVGTGLIGGSFALAMKEHELLTEAGGYGRNPSNLRKALDLGIIDRSFGDLEEAREWADWIFLSIPVDAINQLLPDLMSRLRSNQIVVDFGSTKGSICLNVERHPKRSQYIAAHPIAGTEYSGPEAAFSTLFEDKLMIICEEKKSSPDALQQFRSICVAVGMKLEVMEAEAHDRHLAYISHLSHITSFALSNAVQQREKDGGVILELAGSGFASTVRLAKSSPEMWAPIFLENKQMVLEALGDFLEQANRFREMLKSEDHKGITEFLEEGRKIKRVIG